MSRWFRDGRPADSISIDDRSVQYGDGVFETVAIRDGEPRLWPLHVERLRRSCDALAIDMPADNLVHHDLMRTLSRATADTRFATAKIIVSAGESLRGYRRDPDRRSSVLIGVYESTPVPRHRYSSGIDTIVCDTRVAVQPRLAGIKSLNRLEQVLARAEWTTDRCFDGIMLDADDYVICGTMSNVFTVHDNRLSTPRLDGGGVAGIMRRHILNLLAANDIACEERRISLDELKSADEVFLSNSQFGAIPVRTVDGSSIGVGEVAQTVMMMLVYNDVPECEP